MNGCSYCRRRTPTAAAWLRRFVWLVGRGLGSLGEPMHYALVTAADWIRKLVILRAGVLDAIERRRRLAPHPEISVPSAIEIGFMRAGKRAIPDHVRSAVFVVAGDHSAYGCQCHETFSL